MADKPNDTLALYRAMCQKNSDDLLAPMMPPEAPEPPDGGEAPPGERQETKPPLIDQPPKSTKGTKSK